jgi:hypothetical protein
LDAPVPLAALSIGWLKITLTEVWLADALWNPTVEDAPPKYPKRSTTMSVDPVLL